MSKYKCMVCQPSCLLELRGLSVAKTGLPTGCTFPENGYTPVWEMIGARKAAKIAKKKSAKTSLVEGRTTTPQSPLTSLLF
jgi:hypothetical protein